MIDCTNIRNLVAEEVGRERNMINRQKGKLAELLDSAAVFICIAMLTLPVILFLWGWTKPAVAVTGTALLVWLTAAAYRDVRGSFTVSLGDNSVFWMFSFLCIALWCLFSGIGGFAHQTFDYIVRNPAFRDLCQCSWPVQFPVAGEMPVARAMLGNAETCSYVYYFTWWLPVAAVVKLFNLNMHIANLLLLAWATLETCLVFYCIVNVLKRCSCVALFSLILFGGWDYWMYVIINRSFSVSGTAEWWTFFFSYSSNSTQLFNVFHASLPVWLAICLIMLMEKNNCKGALGALCFAYNPFATLGMVPLTITACLRRDTREKRRDTVRETVSVLNLGTAGLMLVVFGSFYLRTMTNEGISRFEGIVFRTWPGWRIVGHYAAFVFSEVLVYYLALGWQARKNRFYWICLVSLCLIPVYRSGYYNDFALKTSIPFLFVLMILLLQRYYASDHRSRKAVILTALLLGFMTSGVEVHRNVVNTMKYSREKYVYDPFASYARIETGNDLLDELFSKQYLAADTGETFWERIIGK